MASDGCLMISQLVAVLHPVIDSSQYNTWYHILFLSWFGKFVSVGCQLSYFDIPLGLYGSTINCRLSYTYLFAAGVFHSIVIVQTMLLTIKSVVLCRCLGNTHWWSDTNELIVSICMIGPYRCFLLFKSPLICLLSGYSICLYIFFCLLLSI